jgi:hypothetical protein
LIEGCNWKPKTLTNGQEKIKNRKNKNRNEKQSIWEIVIEELNWEKKQNFYKRNKKKIKN